MSAGSQESSLETGASCEDIHHLSHRAGRVTRTYQRRRVLFRASAQQLEQEASLDPGQACTIPRWRCFGECRLGWHC
jgi:hypothetical protein